MTDKMLKRLRSAVVLAVAVWVAALVFAPTANATEEQEPTCPTFLLRGATGAYPAVVFGDAPAGSEVVSVSEVTLTKPTGEALVQPGVEFAAFDLDMTAGGAITVDYTLTGGTEEAPIHGAGAVRLFFYAEQDADTLNDAPDGVAVADGPSGTLSIDVDGNIGTLGMVYDASNATAGTVTFEDLRIDGQPVSFLPEGCGSPSPSPSPSASSPASVTPSAAVSSPATADDLPVTGAPVRMAFGVGGGVLLAGIAMIVLTRVRRRYEAS